VVLERKEKGSGHKGGKGMAGTGKRADHKKNNLLQNFTDMVILVKKGVTSLGLKS